MDAGTALRLPAAVTQQPCADAAVQAVALAQHVAAALRAALAQRDHALLLVSGGRSPVAFFEQLGACELDWGRIIVSLVDERCVGVGSMDRNDALVRRHLLRGPAAAASFVPLIDAGDDAAAELPGARQRLAPLPWPADVVVLGMGADGHTASWFPGADGTAAAMAPQSAERVAIVRPTTAPHTRLTLTLPVVLQARQILLPIEGAAKRAVLERAATAEAGELPVTAVLQQRDAPVRVFHCP
ncbi:MAG TPA: 6-phosphogluconolactonase [Fontimonas sp.]